MLSASFDPGALVQAISQHSRQPKKLVVIDARSVSEHSQCQPLARGIDGVRRCSTLRCYGRFSGAAIGRPGAAVDQAKLFEPRHLPADGGVVATDARRHVDHPMGPYFPIRTRSGNRARSSVRPALSSMAASRSGLLKMPTMSSTEP
jgi:hypothetical protein